MWIRYRLNLTILGYPYILLCWIYSSEIFLHYGGRLLVRSLTRLEVTNRSVTYKGLSKVSSRNYKNNMKENKKCVA